MKNEYFEFLKSEYDNPSDAIKAYNLQKNIWKVGYCSPAAPTEVKESMKLQEKLNDYCEQAVKNPHAEFSRIVFGVGIDEIFPLIRKNMDNFEFIGIQRETLISLASGMYLSSLDNAVREVKSWESLEDLMNQEKQMHKPGVQKDIENRMAIICEQSGITSVLISKASSQPEVVNKINTSLEQLATVVGCEKKQIGLNRYNISIDTDIDPDIAGRSSQYFEGAQKLYVKSKLSEDAFAHEWLHGMDNIWAKHVGSDSHHESAENKGAIKNLLEAGIKFNQKSIDKIKQNLSEKSLTYCHNIIDRFAKSGHIKDVEGFKSYISDSKDLFSEDFNKKDFFKSIQKYKNESCPVTMDSYLATEIETTNHMNFSKNFDNSIFWEFAKKMDKNLVKNGLDWAENYSKSNEERFARMFETYCDIKLKDKKQDNIISYIEGNSYTPRSEEVRSYMDKFDIVVNKMKEIIDEICPVALEEMVKPAKSVINSIEKIRQKSKKNVEEPAIAKLRN